MKSVFPKNFLWGASTSSHQIEGGLTNNWSKWELERVPQLSKKQLERGIDNYISNSKYSCDSFIHYKEDVKVAKEMGLKAYRFSIEWSRIEPEKGVFDFKGFEYYKALIKELKKNDIEPVVTIWHWTVPLWLEKEGGVYSKHFIKYFLRMTKQILENISEDVKYWITINEPEVFSTLSLLMGKWPPNKKNIFRFLQFYIFTFPKIHKGVYGLIKEYSPDAKVSFAKNSAYIQPYNKKIWNVVVANIFRWFANDLQVDLVKGYLDFFALNFYFQNSVGIKGIKNENDKVTDLGWWFKPEAIGLLMKEIYEKYKLPILITENGIAAKNEERRIEWIERTVKAMSECIQSDVEIIGYLYWSLLDNFEWSDGFSPRFGLVSIDSDTKKRSIKDGGKYYSQIIENNGII